VTVASTATLTISPGVTVLGMGCCSYDYTPYGLLDVQGTLDAVGTASQPITFTSGQASPNPGDWYGLQFEPGSSSTLSYATISNAGRLSCYSFGYTYDSCAVSLNASTASLDHVTVTNSSGDGIVVTGGGRLSVSNSTISNNGYIGVYLADSIAPIPAVSITGTRFVNNGGYGLRLANPDVTSGLADNTFHGNGFFDGVYLDGGTLTRSVTWSPDWGPVEVSRGLTIASTATLTLTAGMMVESDEYSGLDVQGALRAVGTAGAPITLTGVAGTPGSWYGLFAESGSSVALGYTTVSDAGSGQPCYHSAPTSYFLYCALYLDGSAATLDHVTVTASYGDGVVAADGGRLSVSSSMINHNAGTGIYLADSTAPIPTVSIVGTRFVGNGNYGLRLANPDVAPGLANNTFSGNGFFDGVYLDGGTLTQSATWSPDWGPVEVGGYLTVGPTTTLTLTAGISVSLGSLYPLDVQGTLRALGTASAPITLTRTSGASGDWGGLSAEPSSTLTLSYATISGAGEQSCYPYSGYAHSVDCAISLNSSTANLDHVTVTANSGDGIDVGGGKVSISNSAITRAYTALYVNSGTVNIHNSVIADDSYGISCSDCASVHAENNYWGTSSGPVPYGSGPGVSYHQQSYTDPNTGATNYYNVVDVAVEPWLGEATLLRQQNGPSGNASSASVGSNAGSANNDTASVAEPVNTASGSYEYSHTDLSLAGHTPLVFARSYNSRTAALSPGPLGYGWTFTYGISLTTPDSGATVLVTFGTGRTDVFTRQSDGSYSAAAGQFDALTANGDGTYDVRDKVQTDYHFDSTGALLSISDHNGNATTLGYNGNGQLTTVAVAGGRSLTLAYNGDGRIASVTDNSLRTVSFAYSPAGDLTAVTDARGYVTVYSYDSGHQLLTGVDRDGHTFVSNTYDGVDAGRVISQTDALGALTTFAYYPASGVTIVTDPRGAATTYTYDNQSRLTSVRDALNGTTSYTYDAQGDRLTMTDPNNHTATSTYDGHGNMLTRSDPLGNLTAWNYDSSNRLLSIVNPLGQMTSYTYDAHENLRTSADALGATTVYTDTAQGDLLQVTDPLAHTTSYSYDAAGDRTGVTDALGHVTATGYDAVGRPTIVTDALSHTTTLGYDAADDVTSSADALGHVTTTAYDAEGNRTGVTDPRGYATTYGYDADNRLTTVTDALGHATRYGYDAEGNRINVTDAGGHTTLTAYDQLERVTSVTSPLGETVSYGYDGAGNRTSVVNARGHTTTYCYDAANRLTGIAYADGSSVAYTYDNASRRASMVDSTGTTSYTYDADGRPTRIVQPAGAVGYSYDLAGNRATLGMPGGKTVTYGYDAVNRLTSVTDWRGGVTTMNYDAVGRTNATTYTNGIIAGYSYDTANHPLGLVYSGQGATLGSFGYTYDPNGNRQTASDSSGTTTYGYDALDRLTSAQGPSGSTSYGYDAAGNRTTLTTAQGATAYSYNEADELTAAGSNMAATYDVDGNRTNSTTGATVTSYTYDDANYLTNISTGASSAMYQYNGDHARVGSTVNGTTTSYLLDLAAPLPTVLQQVTSGVTTTYLYGAGLLAQETGATMQTLLPDALGSTRLVTDASGAVVGHSTYDAYGTQTASGTGSAFGFTGQQADAESGLIYLRARYYDPSTGVFLQRDPFPASATAPTTLNRYAYARDNPLTLADPSGLTPQACDMVQPHGLRSVLGEATVRDGLQLPLTFQSPVNEPSAAFVPSSQFSLDKLDAAESLVEDIYSLGDALDQIVGNQLSALRFFAFGGEGVTFFLSFAQILSEFGCWCQQSPTACEQTARCRGYCQQQAVMAAESTVVTGQYVTGHSALPSTQPAALPICSSVSATNATCSGRGALELTSNLRER